MPNYDGGARFAHALSNETRFPSAHCVRRYKKTERDRLAEAQPGWLALLARARC